MMEGKSMRKKQITHVESLKKGRGKTERKARGR